MAGVGVSKLGGKKKGPSLKLMSDMKPSGTKAMGKAKSAARKTV